MKIWEKLHLCANTFQKTMVNQGQTIRLSVCKMTKPVFIQFTN